MSEKEKTRATRKSRKLHDYYTRRLLTYMCNVVIDVGLTARCPASLVGRATV